jgi:hypothetical protein
MVQFVAATEAYTAVYNLAFKQMKFLNLELFTNLKEKHSASLKL